MDTHAEEFARVRQAFLRAALEEAEAASDPSSRVRPGQVAEELGADPSGEAGPVLMRRHARMSGHCRDTGDLGDLRVSEDGEVTFGLTARGIAAAEG